MLQLKLNKLGTTCAKAVPEMESQTLRLTACRHCGQEFWPRATEVFCCSGCEVVYDLLHREGLADFYRLRDAAPPSCPLPVQVTSETFESFDDPAFVAKMSPDGRRMRFYVDGLNCTACLWLLERLPQYCAAAEWARVDMSASTLDVSRVEGGSFAAIARTLNSYGYRPHPVQDFEKTSGLQKQENRRDMIRIGVAAAATGNIMILAVSLYGGADGLLASQFRWLAGLIALPVLTFCAWPFYKSAWNALRTRHLNVDVPIVAALVAGVVFSLWALFENTDHLYFDSLSMLVFLLLSSRFWLKRIQQHHLDVSHLEDYLLLGSVTRLLASGKKERVSSLALKKDDIIELADEAQVPIDGRIIAGEGLIQTAVLTGESEPHFVRVGDSVEAGSQCLSGRFQVQVVAPANESRLAQILRDAERSTQEKPKLVLFADRVGQWFVGVVFAVALVVAFYFIASDPLEGFSRALALIIVTCPCVFGMAIPLSMSLAIRGAAGHGIILKSGDVIERLRSIRTLYFDKTGTLTKGNVQILSRHLVMGSGVLHWDAVRALEFNQPHPVAKAICRELEHESLVMQIAHDVHLLPTGGIAGRVQGRLYSVEPLAPSQDSPRHTHTIRGHYGVFCEGQLVAQFVVGDEIREESLAVLTWARHHGLDVKILSGDRPEVVASCGAQLGLEPSALIASASPEVKSRLLKEQASDSMMIGDGANDAAALASASVGIAVRGSMDVSLRAADVYLTRRHLDAIPKLFEIATQTRWAIYRNLFFSASFNLVSGVLACLGHMTPLWAAVLMPVSSLTVLISAFMTGRRFNSDPRSLPQ